MSVPWSYSQTTTTTSTSTTASSSSPTSTPPYFIDWLHISPVTHDQSAVSSMMMVAPFQDLSSSARINLGSQEPEHCLHHLYNISDFLGFNKTPPSVIPTSPSPPTIFNSHHRMRSLDSTTTTLINTPSSGSLDLFSPTVQAVGHRSETPQFFSSSSTSLFASSASKFIEDLQASVSPFGNYLRNSAAPFAPLPLEDISPIVRAVPLQEPLPGPNNLSSGPKKPRHRTKRNQTSSFVQKLRSVPSPRETRVLSALDLLEGPIISQRLLSPCKLVPSASNTLQNLSVDHAPVLDVPTSLSDVSGYFAVAPLSLAKDSAERDISSPLTPLTPLSSSLGPSPPPPPLKLVLKLKRKTMDEFPITPPRRSKRSRQTALIEMQPSPDTEHSSSSSLLESSPDFNPMEPQSHRRPVYSNRKLPLTIQISVNYPLFYRRFPASRYYQTDDSDSPSELFGAEHPGGLYNPPRGALDLYTPRFVKGKGVEKVGLCPICIEPYDRGGESKRLWLAMKFSAFKCVLLFFLCQIFHPLLISYHMQYAHGISASTGRPFSPPTEFCAIPRLNPGKKEKHLIQQGKCHKCTQWIAIEGVKDMESKVKELHWWKHAAACHQDSTLHEEGEYYETDDVLMKLISLNLAHPVA
ncbi:hypothetical protein BYT27DRAFT_7232550 [Phlegmacium glaucopus]|nr:hypothetical protein BYT27DRAFT_7232550 [Phlegmacium glaucopus]